MEPDLKKSAGDSQVVDGVIGYERLTRGDRDSSHQKLATSLFLKSSVPRASSEDRASDWEETVTSPAARSRGCLKTVIVGRRGGLKWPPVAMSLRVEPDGWPFQAAPIGSHDRPILPNFGGFETASCARGTDQSWQALFVIPARRSPPAHPNNSITGNSEHGRANRTEQTPTARDRPLFAAPWRGQSCPGVARPVPPP